MNLFTRWLTNDYAKRDRGNAYFSLDQNVKEKA
jgi:hypothetical protein